MRLNGLEHRELSVGQAVGAFAARTEALHQLLLAGVISPQRCLLELTELWVDLNRATLEARRREPDLSEEFPLWTPS